MKTKSTIKSKLIAPCGMNCSICLGYQREVNKCPGCRGSDINKTKSCARCKIKKCTKRKGKYCYTCDIYPCAELKKLDKRYRTKYKMSIIETLKDIKE